MNIGTQQEEIYIEPLEMPEPLREGPSAFPEPTPMELPLETPVPVMVPA